MGRLSSTLDTLAAAMGVHLPPWAVPAAFLALVVLAAPLLVGNVRTGDARALLKRSTASRGEERERLARRALDRVDGRVQGLVALAEEALRQGREDVAREAVARVRARGRAPVAVLRIERALEGPRDPTPLAACIAVERLLEAGARAAARERWERARRRWPDDPELAALAASLEA